MRQNQALIVALALLLAIVLLVPTLGGGMMGGGMMGPGMMGGQGSGWAWGLGWLVTAAFLGIVGVGAVWLVRALGGDTDGGAPRPLGAPLDILKRRYAAGELSREQYDEMRQVLER